MFTTAKNDIREKIRNLIDEAKKLPQYFEPSGFLKECKNKLQEEFSEAGSSDPFEGKINAGYGASWEAAEFLYEHKFLWAAEQLLFSLWNYLGHRQLESKKRTYRAAIGYELIKLYLRSEDRGAATRWALLTHADDMLGEHEGGGGAAKQWLLTTLGMNEAELAVLDEIAAQNIKTVREVYSDDWSKAAGFAEDAVVRFMRRGSEFSHLFAHDTMIVEFPLTIPYFNGLLERVGVTKASNKERGDALEDLASYIFALVPGWIPRRNLLRGDLAFENDVVVNNFATSSNFMAELLGRSFLVECKNWRNRVGVKDVGYFLYRMRLTHAKFGVMIAKNRTTGKNGKAADALLRSAFHEDGSVCVVLDRDDLSKMSNGSHSVRRLLLERIEMIRFGKPKVGQERRPRKSKKRN